MILKQFIYVHLNSKLIIFFLRIISIFYYLLFMIAPITSPTASPEKHINVVALQNVPEGVPTPKSEPRPECRICLEIEETDDNRLVTPCSCTGSVQYIHVKCFKVWIEKKCVDAKIKSEIYSKKGIDCQICKEKYCYEYETTYRCQSSQNVCKNMRKYLFFTVALIGFIIMDVGLLIALSWFAQNDKK